MTSIFTEILDDVKSWFTGTVVPDAEKAAAAVEAVAQTWLTQFETDFGGKALAAAITAVASFAAGGFPAVPAIAVEVTNTLLAQGLSTAEADAQTVILNAARTALNHAQAVSATASPNAAATPASGDANAAS